jgi:hypothetical protein
LIPEVADDEEKSEKPELTTLTGSLESILEKSRPASKHIVMELSKSLGFTLQDEVTDVTTGLEESRRTSRGPGRGRGPRQSSGRRELLKEVTDKWPELGDDRKWVDSPLLKAEDQETLLAEIKELPSWKNFDERRQQIASDDQKRDERELRTVKFRRLMNALETIVLEKNMPHVATPEIVERYRKLVTLEESTLNSK